MKSIPRLYAIVDAAHENTVLDAAAQLAAGGVTLLQYRNKSGSAREILDQVLEIKRLLGSAVKLIMNDRADLCAAAGFDGLHLGQDDLSLESARRVIGGKYWIGKSTHNPQQVAAADQTSADYIAVGPVFFTSGKMNPDPVIGLEGVRAARRLTSKPLVAIGGINRANCRSVIDAGADSVAVISDLIREPRKSVEEFLAILG